MSDEVTLSRADAEVIWAALDTARGFHLADDLRTQFKNTGGTHRPSNLTRRIDTAIEILDAAVATEGEDVVSNN